MIPGKSKSDPNPIKKVEQTIMDQYSSKTVLPVVCHCSPFPEELPCLGNCENEDYSVKDQD